MSKELDTLPLLKEQIGIEESIYFKNSIDEQFKQDNTILDRKAAAYWNKCLNIIKDNVTNQVFKTWFEPLKALKWIDNQLTIKVPSQFYCEWIESHYFPLLQKTIVQVMGDDARLQYEVVIEENIESLDSRTIKLPALRNPPSGVQSYLTFPQSSKPSFEYPNNLNERYTFDKFVNGDSNQLAYSAAMAVSQKPGGTKFNPLVIYGGTGLGKTHLAQSIGNFIVKNNQSLKVVYTTSERFTIEFVNAIQNNKQNEFVAFYRNIDVLIVDDIQFFAGKEKTQDHFFHTFNDLHQWGKQVILTSDKPPRELTDVDERLISRFQWGLIVDIQPPDLEMRMAILQRKSEDEGISLPMDVTELLARLVTNSIRELEGALISLLAKVSFDNRELNTDLVREIVIGSKANEVRQITIDLIKEAVSSYYKIPTEQLESKSRKHEVTLARQMAIYLAKMYTHLSLKSIGSQFGKRDHSTVLHSCQSIENYLLTDKSVKIAYENLLKKINPD